VFSALIIETLLSNPDFPTLVFHVVVASSPALIVISLSLVFMFSTKLKSLKSFESYGNSKIVNISGFCLFLMK